MEGVEERRWGEEDELRDERESSRMGECGILRIFFGKEKDNKKNCIH